MPIRFFDMQDDLARNSWLIADVEPNGPSDWFRHRACLERVPPDYAVPLTIHNPGPSTDITYSSPVGTLIVTAAVADVFCRFCGPDDVQCLEARIENGPVGLRSTFWPLKDADSGQMPESRTPTTTPAPAWSMPPCWAHSPFAPARPRNSGDL